MPATATSTAYTFGIEIECLMPATSTAHTLANSIHDAGVECHAEHYNHNTRPTWKIVTDSSVSGRGRTGIEVVSPILRGEDGLAEVTTVMNVLKAAGCKVNRTCGLHVHIGVAHLGVEKVKNFCRNYIKFEDFFDFIQPESRRQNNNQYIRSNRGVFGDYTSEATVNRAFDRIDTARTMQDLIDVLNPYSNRYYKLNLTAFRRYGTLEFRQHSGTIEAEKACNWVRLLMAFVDGSANGRPRKRTRTDVTATEAFTRFFTMFRCKELRPYFTARRAQLAAITNENLARAA